MVQVLAIDAADPPARPGVAYCAGVWRDTHCAATALTARTADGMRAATNRPTFSGAVPRLP